MSSYQASKNKELKIAIVVKDRFHAFDLARALLSRGHRVVLLTSFPKWAVRRFGFQGDCVRSFWFLGGFSHFWMKLRKKINLPELESLIHSLFGYWAAWELGKEQWDVIYTWSSVSEEVLKAFKGKSTLVLLVRGSAHIRTQNRILNQEKDRSGVPIQLPSKWVILREEREYQLANRVVVLSSFSYKSFVEEGFPKEKLCLLPLGIDFKAFRPSKETIESRCQRIRSGEPLRVLYTGLVSYQKGFLDMASIIRCLGKGRFCFRLVGAVPKESRKLVSDISHLAEFIPSQPQQTLPKWYAWADVYIFPTLQDGFPGVLVQAQASALPILTTAHCSGPDIIQEDESGWILPIRSPDAFIERLGWCDAHREELADMVRNLYQNSPTRSWENVVDDFEAICFKGLG